MTTPLFQSFFMGGFECATHRRRDRTRIDVLAATRHDQHAEEDYRLLARAGIRTVRDGLRWHRIEAAPGVYDWSSFLPMLHAAHAAGTQVLWDLCHWGVPDWLDIFSTEFVTRFAAFAGAAASLIRTQNHAAGVQVPQFYCPINEVSFWSWVGGDVEHFYPFAAGRAPELKQQLVRASLAAMRAVREADPSARFVQAEPIIHISPSGKAAASEPDAAARHTAAQFEVWDMLAGRAAPELGGAETMLDLIGVNYYWNNQWEHEGPTTPLGHPLHRPLHAMLFELWTRYGRPLLITETGVEAGAVLGWFAYICAEVREAQRLGVPVLGICLYPVADYPGWDDDRHCPCGVIAIEQDWSTRHLREPLCRELLAQQMLF